MHARKLGDARIAHDKHANLFDAADAAMRFQYGEKCVDEWVETGTLVSRDASGKWISPFKSKIPSKFLVMIYSE